MSVDVPIAPVQWIDRDGSPTPYFYQFIVDMWNRAGGFDGGVIQSLVDLGDPTADAQFIVSTGAGTFAFESDTTARASMGVTIGSQVQAYDATLQSLSSLGTAADKIAYTTAIDTWAETGLTTFGRSIIDDATEADFKATVNLEIGTDVQAYSAALANLSAAGQAAAADNILVSTAAGVVAWESGDTMRTSLGLAIGTNVQAYDADLAAIAALSNADSNIIVGNGSAWVAESGATARTSLGVGTGDSPTFTALTLSGTASDLYLKDTNGTSTHNVVNASNDGGFFILKLRDNTNVLVQNMYEVTLGASGVTQHNWLIGSGNAMTLTSGSLTVSGSIISTSLQITNLKANDGTAAGSIANSTGVVTLASSVLTTTDINGGTIDGATIATSNITVGAGKTLDVSAGTLTLADNQIAGAKVAIATATTRGSVEFATDAETVTGTSTVLATTPANITAKMSAPGPIGNTTASTGAFTTLTASGNITASAYVVKKVTNAITANSTQTQASATALTSDINRVTVVGTNGDGVKLPTAVVGMEILIINDDASQTLRVWPATGQAINDGSSDAADISQIVAGAGRRYTCTTANNWYSVDVVYTSALPGNTAAQNDTAFSNDLASGQPIYIQTPGTYLISTTLAFPTGTILKGAGRELVTIKLANSSNTSMGVFNSGATDIAIDGITFDGNKANQAAGTHYGLKPIAFSGLFPINERISIRDCYFKNVDSHAIIAGPCDGFICTGNIIDDPGDDGIQIYGFAANSGTTTGTTSSKLVALGQNFTVNVGVGYRVLNTTTGTRAVVTVVDSDELLTLDNDIMVSGQTYVIYCCVSNFTISNNVINSPGGGGVSCSIGNNGAITGNTVTDPGGGATPSDGITGYHQCNNEITATGNTVTRALNHGVHMGGDNLVINSNTITRTSVTAGHNGIMVLGYDNGSSATGNVTTCNRSVISGNTVDGGDACITVESCVDYNINGNTIYGGTGNAQGIYVNTGTGGIVANNELSDGAGVGVLLHGTTQTQVSGNWIKGFTGNAVTLQANGVPTQSTYNTVTNNYLISNGAGIVETGSADNNKIFGNHYYNQTGADLTIVGAATKYFEFDENGNVVTNADTQINKATPILTVGGAAVSTGDCTENIGNGRTGDGISVLNLHSDSTGNYMARFLRNGGANGITQLGHRGTGDFQVNAIDAADVVLLTNSTEALRINKTTQIVTIDQDIILGSGSITSASGAISFGNENLSTTGTLGAGATTLTESNAALLTLFNTTNNNATPVATTTDVGHILFKGNDSGTTHNLGMLLFSGSGANWSSVTPNLAAVDFHILVQDGTSSDNTDFSTATPAVSYTDNTTWNFRANNLLTTGTLNAAAITGSGILSIDDTTDSTSTTTGSIHTDGGLGVVKDTFIGGSLTLSTSGEQLAIGGAIVSYAQAAYVGSFTTGAGNAVGSAVRQVTTLTGNTGKTSLHQLYAAGAITTQGLTQTVNDVSTVRIDEPILTVGTGDTVTNASSLLITGAPTEGGSNYAILVDSGAVKLASGDLTVTGTAPIINLGDASVSTGTCLLQIGDGRTGDGISVINLHSDSGGAFTLRLIRNGGANGISQLGHEGTGDLQINAIDAAAISLLTNSTEALRIDSSQEVYFPLIGTTASAANVTFTGASNQILLSTSSRRYKNDITDLVDDDLLILDNARPIKYKSNSQHDDPDLWHFGLIAEEVFANDPRLVVMRDQGRVIRKVLDDGFILDIRPNEVLPESVQYERFVVPLLAGYQKQKTQIQSMQQDIAYLKSKIL